MDYGRELIEEIKKVRNTDEVSTDKLWAATNQHNQTFGIAG